MVSNELDDFKLQNSTLMTYKIEGLVVFQREKLTAKEIGEWIKHFEISYFGDEQKLAYIDLGNDRVHPFNFAQIKPYLIPAQYLEMFLMTIANSAC